MGNNFRTYAFNPRPGARPTGRFANNPMRKLESAEIAAVVVIRSLLTSSTHARYVASEVQPSPVGHTQVPPVSERMDALTDILYRVIRQLYNATRNAGYDGRYTPSQPEGK